MRSQRDSRVEYLRRALVFASVQLFLACAVLFRLAYLQIYKAPHYSLLSERNRLVTRQIIPQRGKIIDSQGTHIAKARAIYSVMLDLFELTDAEKSTAIKTIYKLDLVSDANKEGCEKLPKVINSENRYVLLNEDLSWQSLARYYMALPKVPGMIIEKDQTRIYLHPEAVSHVIGYTGTPTKEDIEIYKKPALNVPTAKIGKTGLEKYYEEQLFGTPGVKHEEVNAKRQFVKDIGKIDAIPGQDLGLTINLDLQLEVYDIMSQEESGACVVMDVETGAILAYVSYPGYDINIFTKKVSNRVLKELYKNPYNPMINKVINGLYAPGSVFKMITALTALKKGIINKHTRFCCNGCYELGSHKFHCWKWKYGGHGSVNLEEALAASCDVYFYNLAMMLSPDDIAQTARDFGLGATTGVDLPNEKSGLIPTKAWKKEKKKQRWSKGDTFNMAIGQGFVLVTPLQLAKMISMLVNGGKNITPHLKKTDNIELGEKLSYNAEHMNLTLNGMNLVVNSNLGTARASAISDPEFKFGGKTGSSQVFHITAQQRREGKTVSDDYWKKEHAVFVGYAPVNSPKIAVVVLIEHGGGGAHTAAPIARDVLLAAKKHLKL